MGEEQQRHTASDYLLPSSAIGVPRMPLVVASPGGSVEVVLPAGAHGSVELPGRGRLLLEEARKLGAPCTELANAHTLPLVRGAKAREKVVSVEGIDAATLRERLLA